MSKKYQKRIRRLKGLGYLLQLAPFVKALILTGSMTTGIDGKLSDIDLLVITAPGRLYTARFFVVLLTAITGWRRKPGDTNPAGKFCLNYFLAEDNLDIKPHTKECAQYHRRIIRIWDRDGEYEKIFRDNFWLYKYPVEVADMEKIKLLKSVFPMDRLLTFSILRRMNEFVFLSHKIESFFYNWQKKKIEKTEVYKKNKKTIVVLPGELRLHPKKNGSA